MEVRRKNCYQWLITHEYLIALRWATGIGRCAARNTVSSEQDEIAIVFAALERGPAFGKSLSTRRRLHGRRIDLTGPIGRRRFDEGGPPEIEGPMADYLTAMGIRKKMMN
jgi:hypothetical protein